MDSTKLDSLIRRYEEVYMFATRKISSMITDLVSKDLTMEQYYVLHFLDKCGSCASSELADHFGVNRSAITAMIDRLDTKGYVRRVKHGDDRRMVYLEITEDGEQIRGIVEEKIRQLVESYLQELGEEDLENFVRIYERIANIIAEKNGGV
ncbi:MarR family winged helix-turn-helix transcriptional regulator [Gorillibacterium sp. sgz5001074]|uniref:MarR family winged helix-turn-helix transcriptional regulator n=1 Tax=Gorillibacterium sp. sgz5001074 TaxID=3446695 RepID=UPI003F674D42